MQTARRVLFALYCWSEFAVMAWGIIGAVGLIALVTGPQTLAIALFAIALVAPPAARVMCEGFIRLEPVLRRMMIE